MSSTLLNVHPRDSHSGDTLISTLYTLRACNRDYRRSTGRRPSSGYPPEVDGCTQLGKIAPLTTFHNGYGHCINGDATVYPPAHHASLGSMCSYIKSYTAMSLRKRYAWDLMNTVDISLASVPAGEPVHRCISSMNSMMWNPISCYSAMAYVESSEKRGRNTDTFSMPSQSTLMTGIFGGINNNMSVEMGFEESEGVKDMDKRSYSPDMMGFMCTVRTAHSQDAGKQRILASYTRVRIISQGILDSVSHLDVSASGDWTVYCMGSTCNTNLDGICSIVETLRKESISYGKSQFDYPKHFDMHAPATYAIDYDAKILLLSISSGVVLRLMPDGCMIDSWMLHSQPSNPVVCHDKIPGHGSDSLMYKNNPFALFAPYWEDDRPPRNLLASTQTVQAVCVPWAPATAQVSPCHVSRPLVSTSFGRQVETDMMQCTSEDAMWDIMPGEDMCICFLNMPLNYEDSMVVSSRYADLGGFATLSICTYRLSPNDTRPAIGELLCGKAHKWWKMPCTSSCACNSTGTSGTSVERGIMKIVSNPRVPSGVVMGVSTTDSGEMQIRVLSYSQLLTGDKISTTHGQKGVCRIVPYEDLPVVTMKDGTQIIADLYMAVSSVVSRQTVGQVYESGMGWKAASQGQCMTATPGDLDIIECSHVMSGETGETIMAEYPSGEVSPIKCTVGFVRVFNQTQMTRERHHLTHRSEGEHSLGTSSGRSAGGGVAASEMDFHAMYSSGLLGCAQELYNRGNVVRAEVCTGCGRIKELHDCDNPRFVPTRLSYETIAFDMLSACISNTSNVYDVSHV